MVHVKMMTSCSYACCQTQRVALRGFSGSFKHASSIHTRSTRRTHTRRFTTVNAALEDVVTLKDDRVPTEPTTDDPVKPATLDAEKFDEHWSVAFWRDFNAKNVLKDVMDESSPVGERLDAFQKTLQKALSTSNVLQSTEAAQYWGYHFLRSGFFSAQAILGLSYARTAANREERSTEMLTRMEAIAKNGWQV